MIIIEFKHLKLRQPLKEPSHTSINVERKSKPTEVDLVIHFMSFQYLVGKMKLKFVAIKIALTSNQLHYIIMILHFLKKLMKLVKVHKL